MNGYYRFPTIYEDQIVFVCEDDLWAVAVSGGIARRLTASRGGFFQPHFSPDGQFLAFSGLEEGFLEIYVMPAVGGMTQRLTYLDGHSYVVGWSPDGKQIIFASNFAQPFSRLYQLYAVAVTGDFPEKLPVGIATSLSFGPEKGMVIGRNTTDLAQWKRYRGGQTGDIWIDTQGDGQFQRLIKLNGNVTRPMWIQDRIYFLSDHEGVGNIYSCSTQGADLLRHTKHSDFYVRHPNTDRRQMIYHSGADLYRLDLKTDQIQKLQIEFRSSMPQKTRRFVSTSRYLEFYELHPEGRAVAFTSRGKAFAMFNWEGGVHQLGDVNGVRYRLVNWLNDGKRLILVSDKHGEEALEIHSFECATPPERLEHLDIGRALKLVVSPKADLIAVTNHRLELLLIDLVKKESRRLDRGQSGMLSGVTWSPDGKWLAYSKEISLHIQALFLVKIETGEIWPLTQPVLRDTSPAFDPDGKYLYFLSYRTFDPIADNLHLEFSFPFGMRPYLITLQKDLPSPFEPVAPNPATAEKSAAKDAAEDEGEDADSNKKKKKEAKEKDLVIDLEGIQNRILPFPVPDGRYDLIVGVKGAALFTTIPMENFFNKCRECRGSGSKTLKRYDFEDRKVSTVKTDVSYFKISRDYSTIIYNAGSEVRIAAASEKDIEKLDKGGYNKKSGWVDLGRAKISIIPQEEWRQMFREAWRLQRDYFWTEDMSGVDWEMIYHRYLPLVERVGTRGEMADLLDEMQGELGTSHAFEFGGDYRWQPTYRIGFLGANFVYDKKYQGYRIQHIIRGDSWDEKMDSPLHRIDLDLQEGDILTAINGITLKPNLTPFHILVNHSEQDVYLTVLRPPATRKKAKPLTPKVICVKTLRNELSLRYREWVERNRALVHEITDGRVGYVHIPDMGVNGYAEFHRYFLAEVDREGLIVDVRFNTGGFVSQLILEKLSRRRLGYDKRRWGEPIPYPADSIAGPVVAIANEFAASDSDLFTHGFKLMKLGPLVGKRTWGGVIGFNLRTALVDGGYTTQPEYSFWFEDIGWQLENYGTEPDIEIEVAPQDYVAGNDPQLTGAIETILDLLEKNPPRKPDFSKRPRLDWHTIPQLPVNDQPDIEKPDPI
ncbi:S41 family peptidase [candidate division KSB1 bacterium]|nr:S41 family peptidase [candidate division KSB1 bacterium]